VLKKKKTSLVVDKKAEARAERLDTPALYQWLDSSIVALGQAYDQWRYHDAPIDYLNSCVSAVVALTAEINKRTNGN
jgi:hypothetical protein